MLRPIVRAVVAATALVVALATPAQALTWGPVRAASGPNAWNPGKSLAATPTTLLSIWATDCPPPSGKCATDGGPYMGVFVSRSAAAASPPSWTSRTRLSPSTAHAERPSIAAEGSTVIASYVTQRRYRTYNPAAPRRLWVRVSTNDGAAWGTPIRLSPKAGRVDYPRVAIADGRLFAVWTAAGSGTVKLAWSDDLGATWTKTDIGTTTAAPGGAAEGFAGYPDIGASGPNVAVAWIASPAGEQLLLTSAAGGADLAAQPPVQLTATSPNDGQHYPAVAGAVDPADPTVAIAYSTDTALEIVTFDGNNLTMPDVVFDWSSLTVVGLRYTGGYGPAVLPVTPDRLAVAVAGCRAVATGNPCDPTRRAARIDILYTATPDQGNGWGTPVRLTDASVAPYRTNDEPSLAVTGSIERLAFVRYQRTFTDYNVAIRSGV